MLDCVDTVPTTRLTAPRIPATADCGCPTTFGTVTPDETTRLTGLPEGTSVPASGSWEMTEPTGTDVLDTLVTVPSVRPPLTIAVVAAACVSATTFGTETGTRGPEETTRLTGLPDGTGVPATGSWLMTDPTGPVVLDALVKLPRVRPLLTMAVLAPCCGSP